MRISTVYIIFGVAGSGKTTIGTLLAAALDIPFYDADDFHPKANIKKMASGIPLTDTDRMPWLELISKSIINWQKEKGAVLACSALKKHYRTLLDNTGQSHIQWIFLDVDENTVKQRLNKRKGHFFREELMKSQFETLEPSKSGIVIDANQDQQDVMSQIRSKLKNNSKKSQLGLIGLGVMGKSLSKNILSKGIHLSVYNRQVAEKEVDIAKHFVEKECDPEHSVLGFDDLAAFVNSIEQPRTILIMVHAGKAIDTVIESLLPIVSKGDCIIDGGNSHFKKTKDRELLLRQHNIGFLGVGISGGEEGALYGPSLMPGGTKEAYKQAGKFLEAIAARDKTNQPCCAYMGKEGSGHFIKMIHNGIEYAEMQLLAEIYYLLRFHYNKTPDEISTIFEAWKAHQKDSFLLEITIDILRKKEGDDFLIDKVLDKAGQKGTGGWSTNAALELGMPLNSISEAVMARNLSGMKSERVKASSAYTMERLNIKENDTFMDTLEHAFFTTSIINHAIGFEVLEKASKDYQWDLNLSEIARVWTNGCIIRSELMETISELFKQNKDTSFLLFPTIRTIVTSGIESLKETISLAMMANCPLPVMTASLNYFLIYSATQSSANIIQAQRDYFGAHTYQRVDKNISEYFHTNWKSK